MNGKSFILIENDAARLLADWISIGQDLNVVIKSCRILEECLSKDPKTDEDGTIVQALWTSALIRYARCFATGRRCVHLEKELFSGLAGDPIGTHQYYIDTRNKHIAHPVNVFEEVKVGILPSDTFPSPPAYHGVGHLLAFRISDSQEGVAQLGRLATVALQHAQAMIRDAEQALRVTVDRMSETELSKLKQLVIQPQGGADAAKQPRS